MTYSETKAYNEAIDQASAELRKRGPYPGLNSSLVESLRKPLPPPAPEPDWNELIQDLIEMADGGNGHPSQNKAVRRVVSFFKKLHESEKPSKCGCTVLKNCAYHTVRPAAPEAFDEMAHIMKTIKSRNDKTGRRGAIYGHAIEDFSDSECRELVFWLLNNPQPK